MLDAVCSPLEENPECDDRPLNIAASHDRLKDGKRLDQWTCLDLHLAPSTFEPAFILLLLE
jgi:hypothetical protein